MPKLPSDSGARPSALFLTPEAPFPAIGGGALRSASVLMWLAARYRVDVVTFRQPGEGDPRADFPAGVAESVRAIDLPAHSKAPHARVGRNLMRAIRGRAPLADRFSGFERELLEATVGRQYELAVVEHFWCAGYVSQLRGLAGKIVLDLHNIESAWHGTMALTGHPAVRLLHRRFQASSRRAEAALLPRFDHLLVTSEADAARVSHPSVSVYPNAIPSRERFQVARRQAVVFTGNLEYEPNLQAMRRFRARIWPELRQRHPGLRWEIVGKNPHAAAAIAVGDERIDLIGPVEDAVQHIAGARVAVVPLLSGSGTRIKILESWAAGTPVVSTTIGAEGLEAGGGVHLELADSPGEFAQAVTRLLTDADHADRIGQAGRVLFENCYTWEAAWRVLEGL